MYHILEGCVNTTDKGTPGGRSFNSRPSCEGRPRQKLNFAEFSALEAPKRCYYIKDYEPLMSKIDDFVVCYLYDVAENGKIFREPPGEIM